MVRLGFKYCKIKAGFFTDNHEHPAVKFERDGKGGYIDRCRVRDIKQPVWVTMTIDAAKMNKKYKHLLDINNPHLAYLYRADDPEKKADPPNANYDCVEFHVDLDFDFFKGMWSHKGAVVPDEYQRYNGCRSVRWPAPNKLLCVLGQDESVFKANKFSYRVWQETGNNKLRPKGEGTGVMVSGYVSAFVGWNRELTPAELEGINLTRRGKTYMDEDAAMQVHNQIAKQDLKETPFIRYLKHGANREGWWDYFKQIIQMEDVVDMMKYLFPECDIVLEVDNSSGHGKHKSDGLNAATMGYYVGGEQPKMHSTTITSLFCLGTFPTTLVVGSVQHCQFQENDPPPYFNPTQPKYDIPKPGAPPKITRTFL